MPLITCPDCGNPYEDTLAVCPVCARPNPMRTSGGAGGGGPSETPRGARAGGPGGGGAYAGGPGAAYPGAPPGGIPNYLVFAVVLTLCCCPPLGIPALINAARVDARRELGDTAGAWEASRNARKWCLIALGVGIAFYLLQLVTAGGMVAFVAQLAESAQGTEGM